MNNKISIVVSTKDRPDDIKRCLESIVINTYKSYEIIIIDQSKTNKTERYVNHFKKSSHIKITYLKSKTIGASNGRNMGINLSEGDIVAFTDDDCIISSRWLSSINTLFNSHSKVVGVFGKTIAYNPQNHLNLYCPSTFDGGGKHHIYKPRKHWVYIGFGNNMAFRKDYLQLAKFKTYLGPGSIGSNAEDAEFALRALVKKQQLFYSPKMIIYHNKWLTSDEMRRQQFSYDSGEMACYSYFLFQGQKFANPIIKNGVYNSYYKIRRLLKNYILLKWNITLVSDTKDTILELIYRVRGLTVGFIYSIFDKI